MCLQDETSMPGQRLVKIDDTTLLRKIIIVYALKLAQISWVFLRRAIVRFHIFRSLLTLLCAKKWVGLRER